MAGAEGRHLLGLHWTTPSRPAAPAIVSNPLTPHPSADVCAGADLGRGRTDELVEANLRFVFRIAGEYRDLGLPLEDLVNEGNIGLLEAARRFDSTRGTRFITYAVWWVRKAIRRALTRYATNVYVPEYQLKMVRRLIAKRCRGSWASRSPRLTGFSS